MKKIITTIILILLTFSMLCSIAMAKEFSDVPSTHWAHEYISSLSDKGTINGYQDGTFKPSGTITNAEFIKLMVSQALLTNDILKKPIIEGQAYTERWYDLYVGLGQSFEILPFSDYSDAYLKSPITRLDMAITLNAFYNYINSSKHDDEIYYINEVIKKIDNGEEITPEDVENIKTDDEVIDFNDTLEIDSMGRQAISNISKVGLIQGYKDNTFKPYNNMTRAEASTIVYRFAKLMEEL